MYQRTKFDLIQPSTSVIKKCQEFCWVMGEMFVYHVRMNHMIKGKGIFADIILRFAGFNPLKWF